MHQRKKLYSLIYIKTGCSYSIDRVLLSKKYRKVLIPKQYKNQYITSIGQYAFSGCNSLTSIVIPDSVTSIGSSAFSGCISLQYNEYGNCYYLGNEVNPYLVLVKAKNTSITTATISKNTRVIMDEAFFECSSLRSIVIPDSVKCIGYRAFAWCSSLIIYCVAGNEPRGWDLDWNFSDRPVYWGATQKDIICQDGLQYLIIDGKAVVTGHEANITEIVIPSQIMINGETYAVISIGKGAFSYCGLLTSIVIPDSVTSIKSNAFSGCSSLTYVYYTGTIENWCRIAFGRSTFGGCASNPMSYGQHFYLLNDSNEYEEVTEIVIPDTITFIGQYQFYGFNNVTSVVIPVSVQKVETDAFEECYSLTTICYTGSIENWCRITFDNATSNPMYYARYWSILDNIIQNNKNDGNRHIRKELILLDLLLNHSNKEWWNNTQRYTKEILSYLCKGKYETTEIVIPNTITSIGRYQFYGFNYVTSVVIPDSVTSIEGHAFSGCSSLTSIVIPDSVTSIGHGAFNGCSSLESITLPFVGAELNGTSNTHFGYIFGASSYSYNSEYVPSSLKEVIITDEQKIDGNAFFDCHFKYRFAHTLSESEIQKELINNTCILYQANGNLNEQHLGLGFIIRGYNYVITCLHVVKEYLKSHDSNKALFIKFDDGRNLKYETKVDAYDETTDIAIMKIVNDDFNYQKKGFEYSKKQIKLFTSVYSISKSKGNVLVPQIGTISKLKGNELYTNIIRQKGDSGGPLLTSAGKVIAMCHGVPEVTASINKHSVTSMGRTSSIYIPIGTILTFIKRLLTDK